MAGTEFPAELQKRIAETGPVDLLVGVTGDAAPGELCAKARNSLQGAAKKVVIAYAGAFERDSALACQGSVQLVAFPMATRDSGAFWSDISNSQRCVLALAAQWGARACLVVHNDLAALAPETVRLLVEPTIQGQVDLMMPVYIQGKYEGLISKCLLAPFSRALYGRRVRFPLAFDFCAGGKALEELAEKGKSQGQSGAPILWPANEVRVSGGKIGQSPVAVHHAIRTDHFDLSAVLAEIAGSLFQEAEANAAKWQRVRGSESVARFGSPSFPAEDPQQIDARPMVESFVLASRNLEEVWRLVLPPATMLELRRMARLDVEHFRMPDALWARIVYDFALAHRMRRVSRTHVLGALTPLYLGWVASYTQDVAGATGEEADRRIGQLAKAFEEQKPYFVSRWRWPERAS